MVDNGVIYALELLMHCLVVYGRPIVLGVYSAASMATFIWS